MRKMKPVMNALFLIGMIYSVLGGFFVILGAVFWSTAGDSELQLVGMIFTGIGGIFLLLGVLFLTMQFYRQRRERQLVAAGRYIWGEIVECVPNYAVRVNGRSPYMAVVRHCDSSGTVHIFKSSYFMRYPDPSILNRKVKVYISDESYQHYYVDICDVIPNVIEH